MEGAVLNADGRIDVIATLKASLPEARAVSAVQAGLVEQLEQLEEAEQHAALLHELERALHVLGVTLPLAIGLGVLPAAVAPFAPAVVAALEKLLQAAEGK